MPLESAFLPSEVDFRGSNGLAGLLEQLGLKSTRRPSPLEHSSLPPSRGPSWLSFVLPAASPLPTLASPCSLVAPAGGLVPIPQLPVGPGCTALVSPSPEAPSLVFRTPSLLIAASLPLGMAQAFLGSFFLGPIGKWLSHHSRFGGTCTSLSLSHVL